MYDELSLVGGLTLYGPKTGPSESKRTGLVSFNCDTVHATDLSFFLDQEGVAVRTGRIVTYVLILIVRMMDK